MNLNNGDMLQAEMHAGSHHIINLMAPSMHFCIKCVTIVEIYMLILDVSVCQFFSHNVFRN